MSHFLHHTILMTGAAGGLGQVMRARLKANCEVLRLSDVSPMAPAQAGEEVVQADLADAEAVKAWLQANPAVLDGWLQGVQSRDGSDALAAIKADLEMDTQPPGSWFDATSLQSPRGSTDLPALEDQGIVVVRDSHRRE